MKLVVSCISTRHSVLKDHWTQSSEKTECPVTVRGSLEKPNVDLGGLVCLLEIPGGILKTFDLPAAAGMVLTDQGLLITTSSSVHEIDASLEHIRQDKISLPYFNALHSLSRTQRGYIVASTGLDLLIEFDLAGNILWTWWATEHGFDLTPTGSKRELDKTLDYRTKKFGTLGQTTHVNSVAELSENTILATLFHQGTVIAIDRETGHWRTVLGGLDHPHAVRILDQSHFTIADTVHGRALLVRLDQQDGLGTIEASVDAHCDWLQDSSYNPELDTWVLVDGQHSRVSLRQGREGQRKLASYDFEAEWRLYEALLLG